MGQRTKNAGKKDEGFLEELSNLPPNLAIRRLPLPILTPSLTRHMVYRPKVNYDPTCALTVKEELARQEKIINAINEFIKKSVVEDFDPFLFSVNGRKIQSDGERRVTKNQSVLCHLKGSNDHFQIKCVFNLHAEAFTMSLAIEPAGDFQTFLIRTGMSKPTKLTRNRLYEDLRDIFPKLADFSEEPFGHQLEQNAADDFIDKIFSKIWERTGTEIKYQELEGCFQLVADFRGVVFTSRERSALELDIERREQQGDRVIGDFSLAWDIDSPTEPREGSPPAPRRKGAAEIFEQNQRYVNARGDLFARILSCGFHEDGGVQLPTDGNTAFCGLLDGLAVYGSTLRAPASGTGPNESWHFIVFGGPSKHQLGRAVARLQRAATARVLALLDHDIVRSVSKSIRHLGLRLDGLDWPEPSAADRAPREAKFASELADIQRDFNGQLNRGRGGFKYRLSRVRDYGHQLDATLKGLRAVPITGWQTYPDFVRRHVLEEINNLGTIKQRSDELEARLRRLQMQQIYGALEANTDRGTKLMESLATASEDTKNNAQKINDAITTMSDLVAELKTIGNESKFALEVLNNSEKKIVKLQDAAEYIAIIAVCYYFAYLLKEGSVTLYHYIPYDFIQAIGKHAFLAMLVVGIALLGRKVWCAWKTRTAERT